MRDVKILLLFNTLCLTAMMAFVPVIGPIVRELGLAEWHGGLVVTIAGVLWMLLARSWGRFSDQHGRKPILLGAAAGFVISYALLAGALDWMLTQPRLLWVTLAVMITLRGLMGAFYAAIPPVSAAHIADTTSQEQRAAGMAQLGAANGLGMVLGPMIGGLLVHNSLTLPLYAAAALPVLGILLLWRRLPPHRPENSLPTKPVRLSDARLRLPLLAILLAMSGVITAQMTVGFFAMDRLGLDPQDAARIAGFAMATVGVTLIVVQLSMSRIPGVSPRQFLIAGTLVAALGFALVSILNSVGALILCYGIMAAGLGLVFPSIQTLASQAVGSDEQGVAAGSISAVQGFAMVIGPLISTLLYEIQPAAPFALSALLLVMLAVLGLFYRQPATAAEQQPSAL